MFCFAFLFGFGVLFKVIICGHGNVLNQQALYVPETGKGLGGGECKWEEEEVPAFSVLVSFRAGKDTWDSSSLFALSFYFQSAAWKCEVILHVDTMSHKCAGAKITIINGSKCLLLKYWVIIHLY